jgi:hypothetical protein
VPCASASPIRWRATHWASSVLSRWWKVGMLQVLDLADTKRHRNEGRAGHRRRRRELAREPMPVALRPKELLLESLNACGADVRPGRLDTRTGRRTRHDHGAQGGGRPRSVARAVTPPCPAAGAKVGGVWRRCRDLAYSGPTDVTRLMALGPRGRGPVAVAAGEVSTATGGGGGGDTATLFGPDLSRARNPVRVATGPVPAAASFCCVVGLRHRTRACGRRRWRRCHRSPGLGTGWSAKLVGGST